MIEKRYEKKHKYQKPSKKAQRNNDLDELFVEEQETSDGWTDEDQYV
jgi:hypothetical protein